MNLLRKLPAFVLILGIASTSTLVFGDGDPNCEALSQKVGYSVTCVRGRLFDESGNPTNGKTVNIYTNHNPTPASIQVDANGYFFGAAPVPTFFDVVPQVTINYAWNPPDQQFTGTVRDQYFHPTFQEVATGGPNPCAINPCTSVSCPTFDPCFCEGFCSAAPSNAGVAGKRKTTLN